MNIAVVAVAYNRVSSLSRLLTSVNNAYFDTEDVTLIISIDKSKTDVVEKFADDFIWNHGTKIVDKHEKNLGLKLHMLSLGKWFDKFEALIVLEDDIVVAKSFYLYAQQTVSKYYSDSNIAGISLYAKHKNLDQNLLFMPIKDCHDVFFMNYAMSWGEIWMKDSWLEFYNWYQENMEFPSNVEHLPRQIVRWDSRSWLKHHIRYCIENDKYFVYPYYSFSTNYGDEGEHSKISTSTIVQVPLVQGQINKLNLEEFTNTSIKYDGFMENKVLAECLGINQNELCIDLNGGKQNREHKRYWLTTTKRKFKILMSFGLRERPIEMNVINRVHGSSIFLYDTSVMENNSFRSRNELLLYSYFQHNLSLMLNKYGLVNLLKDIYCKLKSKFLRCFSIL